SVAGKKAQGTITFKLYGPDAANQTGCPALAAGFPEGGIAVAVSGDGTYGPVEFTPQSPGTYHWVAEYSGDPPNTNATTHHPDCSDTKESVTVASSETKTTPENSKGEKISSLSIGEGTVEAEDKAEVTVEGTSTWKGTVQFELCGPIPAS